MCATSCRTALPKTTNHVTQCTVQLSSYEIIIIIIIIIYNNKNTALATTLSGGSIREQTRKSVRVFCIKCSFGFMKRRVLDLN